MTLSTEHLVVRGAHGPEPWSSALAHIIAPTSLTSYYRPLTDVIALTLPAFLGRVDDSMEFVKDAMALLFLCQMDDLVGMQKLFRFEFRDGETQSTRSVIGATDTTVVQV